MIDVPAELVPVFKAMARRLGIRYAEVVRMVLDDHVRKRMRLEDSIGKMVAEAFDEELKHIESIVDPHSPSQVRNMDEKRACLIKVISPGPLIFRLTG
jgi:hypothetical protein